MSVKLVFHFLQARRFILKASMLFLLMGLVQPLTHAAVVMQKNFSQFVPVTITHAVSTTLSAVGEPFEMTLADDVTYKDKTLPKGSHLKGNIQAVRSSKRLGRPAQFKVLFNQLVLPTPEAEQLLPLAYEGLEPRQYEAIFLKNNRSTYQSFFSRQLLISTLSNCISIPLGLALDTGWFTAIGIDRLIDGTTGSTQEVLIKSPNDHRSGTHRVAYGFFRGATPFPFLYGMVKKAPPLEYEVNTSLYVQLPGAMWQYVFTQL
jgi:hypothetical protein